MPGPPSFICAGVPPDSPQSNGGYYRFEGKCIPCPDNPWMIAVMIACGGIVLVGLGWMLEASVGN